jgi:hypothetical protein
MLGCPPGCTTRTSTSTTTRSKPGACCRTGLTRRCVERGRETLSESHGVCSKPRRTSSTQRPTGVARSTPAQAAYPKGALRAGNNGEVARASSVVQPEREGDSNGGVVSLWERFRMAAGSGGGATGASAASVRGATPPTPPAWETTQPTAATPATVASGGSSGGSGERGRGESKAAGGADARRVVSRDDDGDGGDDDFMDDAATRRPLRRIPASAATEAESAEEEESRDSTATDGAGGAAVVHVHVIKLPAPPELPPWATRVRSLAARFVAQRRGAVRVHVRRCDAAPELRICGAPGQLTRWRGRAGGRGCRFARTAPPACAAAAAAADVETTRPWCGRATC